MYYITNSALPRVIKVDKANNTFNFAIPAVWQHTDTYDIAQVTEPYGKTALVF